MEQIKLIITEIERLLNSFPKAHGKILPIDQNAYNLLDDLKTFIESLPAEQPCEDLEEEITMIPSNENYLSEQKISEFVDRKFFRCVGKFLSWLRLGETYWFEYIGNDHYTVRSDNNLGEKFEMTQHQLLTKFFPVNCETDKLYAMKYCHLLGELGIHKGYIDDIYNAYRKFQSEQPSEDLEEAANNHALELYGENWMNSESIQDNGFKAISNFKFGANWQKEQNQGYISKLEAICISLWDILDDIDTYSDLKIDDTDPNNPFKIIEEKTKKRHIFVQTDGYDLFLNNKKLIKKEDKQ